MRDNLSAFFKGSWDVIEPATKLSWSWHHDAICEHMQAVAEWKLHKLIIAVPPRHTKSSVVSVAFPAWLWITHPGARFLCASYGLSLSLRDSQRCRDLIDSPWYQSRWGNSFSWLEDQNAKGRYQNTSMGYRIATSVGGAATGEGADYILCVSGGTKIQTQHGIIPIHEIVDRQIQTSVLTYNHSLHRCEYQAIEAYEKTPGRPLYKVVCSNGDVVECTDNHPFYISGKGYIQTKNLQVGDTAYVTSSMANGSMSSVWKTCQAQTLSASKASNVLQQDMFRCVANNFIRKDLSGVWKNILNPTERCAKKKSSILLKGMSSRDFKRRESSKVCSEDRADVCLRKNIFDLSTRQQQTKVLQQRMRGYSAQHSYAIPEQSEFCRWWRKKQVQQRIFTSSQAGTKTRWLSMYDMSQDAAAKWETTRCASYRLRQREQSSRQSHSFMSILSQPDTEQRDRTAGLEEVSIVSVEAIQAVPEYVYNLRIKKNHNYFANGILTHNCDDAHNIQEGESELVREETLNWWDRVMTSRLNDQQTGCMVVVAQRVHEQDLIGHLLETGDWEYLCLPAEYESEKKTITSIGWEDPRQEDGDVLWEEKFPKVVLEQLKKTLLMHYFAQYQQRPTAAEGALLKDEWFHQYIDAGDHYVLLSEGTRKRVLKAQCRTVISTDFAVSQKQEADYTVFLTWAVTPDLKFLLTDIVRDRMEAPDSEEYLLNMAISSKRLWTVLVEDVAYQKAIIQRLRRGTPIQGTHMKRGIPVTPFRPMVDKTSRVQSLAVYFASECFFFSNQVAGYIEYKKELTGFPRTDHDDRVDATTILLALFAFAEPRISSAEDITEVEENEHIKELMKTNPELAEFLLGESDDDILSILQSLVR